MNAATVALAQFWIEAINLIDRPSTTVNTNQLAQGIKHRPATHPAPGFVAIKQAIAPILGGGKHRREFAFFRDTHAPRVKILGGRPAGDKNRLPRCHGGRISHDCDRIIIVALEFHHRQIQPADRLAKLVGFAPEGVDVAIGIHIIDQVNFAVAGADTVNRVTGTYDV